MRGIAADIFKALAVWAEIASGENPARQQLIVQVGAAFSSSQCRPGGQPGKGRGRAGAGLPIHFQGGLLSLRSCPVPCTSRASDVHTHTRTGLTWPACLVQALEDMLVHGAGGRPPAIPEEGGTGAGLQPGAQQGADSILESGALEVGPWQSCPGSSVQRCGADAGRQPGAQQGADSILESGALEAGVCLSRPCLQGLGLSSDQAGRRQHPGERRCRGGTQPRGVQGPGFSRDEAGRQLRALQGTDGIL